MDLSLLSDRFITTILWDSLTRSVYFDWIELNVNDMATACPTYRQCITSYQDFHAVSYVYGNGIFFIDIKFKVPLRYKTTTAKTQLQIWCQQKAFPNHTGHPVLSLTKIGLFSTWTKERRVGANAVGVRAGEPLPSLLCECVANSAPLGMSCLLVVPPLSAYLRRQISPVIIFRRRPWSGDDGNWVFSFCPQSWASTFCL